MNDYIYRQAAIDALKTVDCEILPRDGVLMVIADVLKQIRAIPSAEVEPVKTGRWIEDNDPTLPSHCSVCGEYALEWVETRYCPWCGAKMEGAEE